MRSTVWRWYLAFGVAATLCYPFVRSALGQDALYVAIGLSSIAAIFVGLTRNRPASRAPWWFMLAGLALWVLGDAVDSWQRDIANRDVYPSIVDAFYLVGYPVIAVGLWLLHRRGGRRKDRAGLLDSVILTLGVGILSWASLGHPTVKLYDYSPFAAAVSVAYPAGDILLLALLFRMVTGGAGRTTSFRLLMAAFGLLIVGDTVSTVVSLWLNVGNTAYDVIWLVSYVAWGAAALHPSMTRLTESAQPAVHGLRLRRVVSLAVATCIAPAVLAVEQLSGRQLDVWPVVVVSMILFVLVVGRMTMAMAEVLAANDARDRLQVDLAYQATHDALTGLPNRAQAMTEIHAAQARGQRSGSLLSLLFIDLDGFKAVNDLHGHAAGDDALRSAAQRLRAQVRAGDFVARLGGDEFVVVLENNERDADAVELATRIVAELAQPMPTADGRFVHIGASVGVAVSQDGDINPERLLNEADIAVYRAKTAGKGRVEIFDDALRRELAEREQLEGDLRAAIAANDLVVQYQPIYELPSGRIEGYEALLRWRHPQQGLLEPDTFVPVAEQSDLICDIDAWVLNTATSQIAALGDPGVTIAVNISGRHASNHRLIDDVRTALQASGLNPRQLVLEITETALGEDLRASEHLQAIRSLGASVSIDDFGTGYSSISRLRLLPVDAIKIDRTFVSAATAGEQALLEVIVRAAHAAGLTAVGEGVETEAQLETLTELGCDSAQGFWLSTPLDGDELATHLPLTMRAS
jgi:diguanylate cyclase (GGDEF)-like protein